MTSFAPKDASTGGWAGGPATVTNPRFAYRQFDVKNGPNAGTTQRSVKLYVDFLDAEDMERKAQYNVGGAAFCQILDGPDGDPIDDSVDENGVGLSSGTSFGHVEADKTYAPFKDSDFIRLMTSLTTAGFPESKLLDGDITVLDGLEVEVYSWKRNDNDRFPLYLIREVTIKGDTRKPAAAAKSTGKAAAKPTASAAVVEAANAVIDEALADGPVTIATLIRKAMAMYKQQDIKPSVVNLLSDISFLNSLDSAVYDAGTKTLTAV